MRTRFGELRSIPFKKGSGKYLGSVPEDFGKLIGEWDRETIKRTAASSEVIFKMVAFRDSQDSLRSGMSMWRLSWITFIFLPLTFSVGLFGMSEHLYDFSLGVLLTSRCRRRRT